MIGGDIAFFMEKVGYKGSVYLWTIEQGKDQGWRYLLGVYLNLVIWFGLSLLLFQLALYLKLIRNTGEDLIVSSAIGSYILSNLMFGVWGLGLWGVMRWIHKRDWRTLIRPGGSIRRGRIVQGFIVWSILIGVPMLLRYGVDPEGLSLSGNWQQWLPFAGLALILTPVQTTVEELFFRGYLIQGLSHLSRRSIVLCGISALIFTLPHLNNPELVYGFWPLSLYYFCFGLLHAWVVLRDGGLELAIGLHAANNLFVALLVTHDNAVIETPALFTTTGFDAWVVLLSFIVRALAFSYLFFPLPIGRKQPQPAR